MDLTLVKVFDGNLVKRKGLDTRVLGLVPGGKEGDEHVDVFFELRQVQRYVVLIELHIFMILHGGGDGEVEVRFLEVGNHRLNEIFDLNHLVFHFFNLALLHLMVLASLVNL